MNLALRLRIGLGIASAAPLELLRTVNLPTRLEWTWTAPSPPPVFRMKIAGHRPGPSSAVEALLDSQRLEHRINRVRIKAGLELRE
jgi:hypothetical protein